MGAVYDLRDESDPIRKDWIKWHEEHQERLDNFRNRRPMVLYIIVAPGHSLYVPLPLQQFVSL